MRGFRLKTVGIVGVALCGVVNEGIRCVDAAKNEHSAKKSSDLATATRSGIAEAAKRSPNGWVCVDLRGRHDPVRWAKHFIYSSIFAPGILERYEVWVHPESGEVRTRVRLGDRAVGHPTVVHGGALAAVLDDTLGAAFFASGSGPGFTANLTVNYRRPVAPFSDLVLRARVVKREGRKVFLEAQVLEDAADVKNPWTSATPESELREPTKYVDASALFVVKAVPKTVEEVRESSSRS